jgi:hypothetical protein
VSSAVYGGRTSLCPEVPGHRFEIPLGVDGRALGRAVLSAFRTGSGVVFPFSECGVCE